MCKVICYHFTCGDRMKLRSSTCRGTYVRLKRFERSIACSSDAHIDIYLPMKCGPCQQIDWNAAWEQRLFRAKLFLKSLENSKKSASHFIVSAISKLVSNLEIEYVDASWDVRTHFPPLPKKYEKLVRAPAKKRQRQSLLSNEVKPEDVELADDQNPVRNQDEEDSADDPWSHEPVINYDNPIYAIDGDWVDTHLAMPDSEEEIDTEVSFDSDPWGSSDGWGHSSGLSRSDTCEPSTANDSNWDPENESSELDRATDKPGVPDVTTAELEDTTAELEDTTTELESTIAAFWTAVNCNNTSTPSEALQILQCQVEPISSSNPSTPPSPTHKPTISKTYLQRLRANLLANHKLKNPDWFHRCWLSICREELRKTENANEYPRWIVSPEVPVPKSRA